MYSAVSSSPPRMAIAEAVGGRQSIAGGPVKITAYPLDRLFKTRSKIKTSKPPANPKYPPFSFTLEGRII